MAGAEERREGSDGHALIRFSMPAPFIVELALPSSAEILYGYRNGWIDREGVVALCLARYTAAEPLSPAEEAVALLLSEDLDRVDDLLDEFPLLDEPEEARARIWVYLSLAWVYEHAAEFEDPLMTVEMLFTDFEYPEEIAHLVRFMPAVPGQPMGDAALMAKWKEFVDHGRPVDERDPADSDDGG